MKVIIFFCIIALAFFALPVLAGVDYPNYSNYSNCVFHAYKDCLGNSVYWFDSCANPQDLIQNCSLYNQICKFGNCVANYKPAPAPAPKPVSKPSPAPAPTPAPAPETTQTTSALLISFFLKSDPNSTQWQKTASINSNSNVYFMFSVANTSETQINNVNVSANIPSEVASLGNLQIDGVAVSGDIVSGINIGSLSPKTGKLITFEGKTQAVLAASTKQAFATASAPDQQTGVSPTDSISIVFNPGQAAVAAVSSTPEATGFLGFLKRWYLWILSAIALIFLFVIIFRRLSSDA